MKKGGTSVAEAFWQFWRGNKVHGTLTFASDKDLAKLQPGDIVEQENTAGDTKYSEYVENDGYSIRPPERAFDGDKTDSNATTYAWQGEPGGVNIFQFFGIPTTQDVVVYCRSAGPDPGAKIYMNGLDTGKTVSSTSMITVNLGVPLGGSLKTIMFENNPDAGGWVISGFEVNGALLVDGPGRLPWGRVGFRQCRWQFTNPVGDLWSVGP